jgi:hypothetical protein
LLVIESSPVDCPRLASVHSTGLSARLAWTCIGWPPKKSPTYDLRSEGRQELRKNVLHLLVIHYYKVQVCYRSTPPLCHPWAPMGGLVTMSLLGLLKKVGYWYFYLNLMPKA